MTDQFLDVLQDIEIGLKRVYEANATCTDGMIVLALKKAAAAIKQKHGYGRGLNSAPDHQVESEVIACLLEIGTRRIGKIDQLTLDDFEKCIAKISRSVDTHRDYGIRGYYEFIRNYV